MEYSKEEKIDAIRGYMKEIITLADRLVNTDKVMKIMDLEENSKVFAGIFMANRELCKVLDRLREK